MYSTIYYKFYTFLFRQSCFTGILVNKCYIFSKVILHTIPIRKIFKPKTGPSIKVHGTFCFNYPFMVHLFVDFVKIYLFFDLSEWLLWWELIAIKITPDNLSTNTRILASIPTHMVRSRISSNFCYCKPISICDSAVSQMKHKIKHTSIHIGSYITFHYSTWDIMAS